MNHLAITHASGASRRGSALVLAVAVLAVLAIFSLTLGYNTRVELTASRNWANGVQARMAAVTGVDLHLSEQPRNPIVAGDVALAGLDDGQDRQSWLRPLPIRLTSEDLTPFGMDDPLNAAVQPVAIARELAVTTMFDAGARINVNALVPQSWDRSRAAGEWTEAELADFIQMVLTARGIAGVDAVQLARNIVAMRYGPDGLPGLAGFDDNMNAPRPGNGAAREDDVTDTGEWLDEAEEFVVDIRRAPAGDDRPFNSVAELLRVPGMTVEAWEALSPYLTVFSVSFAAFELPEQDRSDEVLGFPQVDPNTATPDMLFDALRYRFPDAPESLLAQFAVNIVDYRDADSVPTEWRLNGRTYLGYEMTPYINEVCSDVASLDSEGDDGQFIELYNPYPVPMDVNGWRIEGAGPQILLIGRIAPGGFLVLTDDFTERNDPTPENRSGIGSFYQLFNEVPTGEKRRIEEYPLLDIPNESGEIRLRDAQGRLVDVFTYHGGRWTGASRSFQRVDPRVRFARLMDATPLRPNRGATEMNEDDMKLHIERFNRPFTSALDVMLVSSAYAEPDDGAPASAPWALPGLHAGDSRQLDVRLVDCFRIGARPDRGETYGCDVVHGLLNLNTATPAALSVLPGMDGLLLRRIVMARLEGQTGETIELAALTPEMRVWWMERHPLDHPEWRNFSGFLLDERVWQGRPLYDRLNAAMPFHAMVGTHSVSLVALSANRANDVEDRDGDRRPTRLTAERLIAGDRGGVETVRFNYYGRGNALLGDPDLRYARRIYGDGGLMTVNSLLRSMQVRPREPRTMFGVGATAGMSLTTADAP